MKILLPIDGSEYSKYAIDFLASRVTLLGSNPDIELLNVQVPLPARARRLVGNDALERYYEEEADAAVTRLVGLMEPLLIVFMGVAIGLCLAGVFPLLYGSLEGLEN